MKRRALGPGTRQTFIRGCDSSRAARRPGSAPKGLHSCGTAPGSHRTSLSDRVRLIAPDACHASERREPVRRRRTSVGSDARCHRTGELVPRLSSVDRSPSTHLGRRRRPARTLGGRLSGLHRRSDREAPRLRRSGGTPRDRRPIRTGDVGDDRVHGAFGCEPAPMAHRVDLPEPGDRARPDDLDLSPSLPAGHDGSRRPVSHETRQAAGLPRRGCRRSTPGCRRQASPSHPPPDHDHRRHRRPTDPSRPAEPPPGAAATDSTGRPPTARVGRSSHPSGRGSHPSCTRPLPRCVDRSGGQRRRGRPSGAVPRRGWGRPVSRPHLVAHVARAVRRRGPPDRTRSDRPARGGIPVAGRSGPRDVERLRDLLAAP